MGFADIIRQGVAIASALTVDLQASVTHTPWIGQSGDGVSQYGTPVVRKALVDRTRKQVYTQSGQIIFTLATVTFLDPIDDTSPNANQQRVNPIDPRDLIVLDDGATAPIVRAGGFEDAGMLRPFVNEVVLGNV